MNVNAFKRAISESKATLMFFDWLQIPILFRLIIILWENGRLNGLSIGLSVAAVPSGRLAFV